MATYYVDSVSGSEANSGASGHPWKYIPGMASSTHAASILAGDTIQVAKGSTFDECLSTLAANVTYTGSGSGGDDITYTVPLNNADLSVLTPVTITGSWKIDRSAVAGRSGISGSCIDVQHSGCVFEDVTVIGMDQTNFALTGTSDTVRTETAAANTTMRRFQILGSQTESATKGNMLLHPLGPGLTLEYGRLAHSSQDCIYALGSTANGFWLGYTLTMTQVELGDPNSGYEDAPLLSRNGDCLQIAPTGDGTPGASDSLANRFDGSLTMRNCYVWSRDAQKQGVVWQYGPGVLDVQYCQFAGINGGNAQIYFNCLGGNATVEHNYFNSPGVALPTFRFAPQGKWPTYKHPLYMLAPGVTLRIANNIIDGTANQLLRLETANRLTASDTPVIAAGRIEVEDNICLSPELYSDTDISVGGGAIVANMCNGTGAYVHYADTFELSVQRNQFWPTSIIKGNEVNHIALRLPAKTYTSGGVKAAVLNNPKWVIADNFFHREEPVGSAINSQSFSLGVQSGFDSADGYTLYEETIGGQTGLEKFQAANSSATGNYEYASGLVDPSYLRTGSAPLMLRG